MSKEPQDPSELLRSFLRSLRWIVPLYVGGLGVLWFATDLRERADMGFVTWLVGAVYLVVVLAPIIWLRDDYDGPPRAMAALLVLTALWALVAGFFLLGVVGLPGDD